MFPKMTFRTNLPPKLKLKNGCVATEITNDKKHISGIVTFTCANRNNDYQNCATYQQLHYNNSHRHLTQPMTNKHVGLPESAGRGGSAGINVIGQLPHVVHPPFLCDVYLADISNLKGLREILNVCLCIDKWPFV
jgi:hypothetical protein